MNEIVIPAGALAVLATVLVSSDARVREQVALHLSSRPSAELATAGTHVTNLAAVIFDAARDQAIAHAPLVILVVAAVTLMLFMLKT